MQGVGLTHWVGRNSGSRSLEGIWGPRHWFLRKEGSQGRQVRTRGGSQDPPRLSAALLQPPAPSTILILESPFTIYAVERNRERIHSN